MLPEPLPPSDLKLTSFFFLSVPTSSSILSSCPHHFFPPRLCPLLQQPNIKQKFVALLKRFKVTDEVRACGTVGRSVLFFCSLLFFPESTCIEMCVGATWQHGLRFSRRLVSLEADDINNLRCSSRPINSLPKRSQFSVFLKCSCYFFFFFCTMHGFMPLMSHPKHEDVCQNLFVQLRCCPMRLKRSPSETQPSVYSPSNASVITVDQVQW